MQFLKIFQPTTWDFELLYFLTFFQSFADYMKNVS
jgi:hypothetical protein